MIAFGRINTFKYFIFPYLTLGNNLAVISSNYYLKCIGFFIIGSCHLRFMNLATYNTEICPKEKIIYAPSFFTSTDVIASLFLCLWLIYFSGEERNAINYLLIINVISITVGFIMIFTLVESPYWLIKQSYKKVSQP